LSGFLVHGRDDYAIGPMANWPDHGVAKRNLAESMEEMGSGWDGWDHLREGELTSNCCPEALKQ
jgi:hypothetical protein